MKSEQISNQESGLKMGKTQNGCGDIVGDFVEDVWKVMTPEMVERLKCVLTEDLGLSKEDANKFIQCQREIRRQRCCLKKDARHVNIGPRNQWIKELSKDIADQLAMFVVGTLFSDRTIRTKRITEKVLEHICEITGEDTTIESAASRVERTMVVVADRMATWIDQAISDIEKKTVDRHKTAASLEKLSVASLISTESETESLTESEDHSLDDISDESEVKSTISSTLSVASEERKTAESEEERETTETLDEEESEENKSNDDKSEPEVLEESDAEEEDEESVENKVSEEEEEKVESEEDSENGEDEEEESVKDEEIVEEEETAENISSQDDEMSIGSEEERTLGDLSIDETPEFPQEEDVLTVSNISDTLTAQDVISEKEYQKLPADILDLLKEDMTRVPEEKDKSNRQKAMKEVIDKRFENIAKEKLDKSIDSLLKLDIDSAASKVANWIEKILFSIDDLPRLSSEVTRQGSAFEIKQRDGSQYQVYKLSSTTVANKVAEVRGFDSPIRKKKLPRTLSPMNVKSTKDWADWALNAARAGEEWGKWLDTTLSDVEQQLLRGRRSRTSERFQDWKDWRDLKTHEAQQWRAEKQKMKEEGNLWTRKLKTEPSLRNEKQTKAFTY